MKKPGKITVTFFINTNVKPKAQSPMIGGGDKYPLYVQVTYNRKNTQFRSFYSRTYSNIDEAKSTKEEREHRAYEESLITKVVEYEIVHHGKDFNLKGLNDRYLDYSDSLFNPIDNHFRGIINFAIDKTDSEFKKMLDPWGDENISYNVYFEAAIKLIPGLNNKLPNDFKEEREMGTIVLNWIEEQDTNIRIIDWLDHSAIKAIESHLRKLNYNDKRIQGLIDFVSRILKIDRRLTVY
jgi:hypothetical protein